MARNVAMQYFAIFSGTVRDCYRNAYYYGGDPVTARALLDLQGKGPLDEVGLGDKGASMFRPIARSAVRGRVPFLSNEALYLLLGYPENPLPDRLPDGVNAVEFFRSYGINVNCVEGELVSADRQTGPLRDSRNVEIAAHRSIVGESRTSSYDALQVAEKEAGGRKNTGTPQKRRKNACRDIGRHPHKHPAISEIDRP